MTNSGTPDGPEPHDEGGDPEALERQRMLGARLRTMFDDVVDEGVPDDFMDLLNKLDDQPGTP